MTAKNNNIYDKLNAPVEEAYKVLRTNIQFCGFEKKIKTITITSCSPNEGKTSTSINLGISMAKSGLSVLLVDADLRKPAKTKHLGSFSSTGLSNLISGRANLEDVINSTNIDNFYFISCGPKPPNPAELIGSVRFTKFLNEAEEMYDIVIVDTPPLGSVIDSALIASQTDGTVIVIQSKVTEQKVVQRVKEQLEKANANILGVVLTKIDKSDYKNYYNYYNYYGKSKKKDGYSIKKTKKDELINA